MNKAAGVLLGATGVACVAYAAHGFGQTEAPAQQSPAPVAAERPVLKAEAAPAPAPVGLAVERRDDCLIEPSQVVKVNAGAEGVIESVAADRGQFVSAGQVVARLRSDVQTAGVAVQRARAANGFSTEAAEARAQYLQTKSMRSERLRRYLATQNVEEAQADARSATMTAQEAQLTRHVAQLELIQAQRQLAERVVRSPISGVVTERAMAPGEYRGPQSSHILTVAQLDPLNVEVFAPISQLKRMHVGAWATVIPEEPIGGSYKARITVMDRVFDAASGTFGVRLRLANPGNRLPAGLRCRIRFAA